MKSKNKWKLLNSAILAFVVIGLVVFIAQESSKQEKQLANNSSKTHNPGREPASIQKVFDFSHLQGGALEFAAKQRLASSISISKEEGEAVIELGNFVLMNPNSEKDFACGFYDQIILEFDAEGVAVSGEKPHITVQSGCEVASNINSMEPIHVPVAKLKGEAPSNAEYKFYSDKKSMKVIVANPPPEWPGQWVLTDFKLTHSQFPSRILHVQTEDIKAASGKINMNW